MVANLSNLCQFNFNFILCILLSKEELFTIIIISSSRGMKNMLVEKIFSLRIFFKKYTILVEMNSLIDYIFL